MSKERLENISPKRHRMFWTDEEITYLLEHYHEMSNDELSKKLGRTKQAIVEAYQKFKPDDKRRNKRNIYAYYYKDELKAIGTAKEIAEKLGIQERSIYVYLCKSYRSKNVKVLKVKQVINK